MRRNGDISMIWGEILNTLKRLDNYLSDAVYVHGCYLTGQQEEFCRHRQEASEDHPHEHSNIKQVQVRGVPEIIAQNNKRHNSLLSLQTKLPASSEVCGFNAKLVR
jgi:hypothetical protein